MLGDVVEAAAQVGRVLVVTDDASVVPSGAEIVGDPGRASGRRSQPASNASKAPRSSSTPISPVRRRRRSVCCRTPASRSSRRRTGRRTLSLPDPHVFAPLYGPGSAQRFRAHAGFATVRIPELELDVDSDADLERIGARVGRRTRALLAVPA